MKWNKINQVTTNSFHTTIRTIFLIKTKQQKYSQLIPNSFSKRGTTFFEQVSVKNKQSANVRTHYGHCVPYKPENYQLLTIWIIRFGENIVSAEHFTHWTWMISILFNRDTTLIAKNTMSLIDIKIWKL